MANRHRLNHKHKQQKGNRMSTKTDGAVPWKVKIRSKLLAAGIQAEQLCCQIDEVAEALRLAVRYLDAAQRGEAHEDHE